MHTHKQTRKFFLLFLWCCPFFFLLLFQSGHLFPCAQAVVLCVLKGLSMAQRLVSEACQPVLRLTIPHRDYFNFFPQKMAKKKGFFLNIFFPAEGGKKKGTKKNGYQKKYFFGTIFFLGAMVVKLGGG